MGYAVTDFYAQGMSFKDDAFFLHLLSFDKMLKAGNIRVPISRLSSLDDVKLLAPLWTSEPGRALLKAKWAAALKPQKDLVTEMQRMRALDETTRQQHADIWADCLQP
jgi:hypothetical protein